MLKKKVGKIMNLRKNVTGQKTLKVSEVIDDLFYLSMICLKGAHADLCFFVECSL